VFWGLNIPHLLRREEGIKDEGTGKSMAEWNPAGIELFQLTLTEEEGDSKTLRARSVTPSFQQKLHHFYYHFTLISLPLSVFPSFFTLR